MAEPMASDNRLGGAGLQTLMTTELDSLTSGSGAMATAFYDSTSTSDRCADFVLNLTFGVVRATRVTRFTATPH